MFVVFGDTRTVNEMKSLGVEPMSLQVAADTVIDRENRETWQKAGSRELYQRACDAVESRLAAYHPIETDPALDGELRRLVMAGLTAQTELPVLPPPPDPSSNVVARGRRPNRRRSG